MTSARIRPGSLDGVAAAAMALGVAVGIPAAAEAQAGPSILELLPTEGPSLEIGQERTAVLGDADYRLPDGMVVRAFRLEGVAGAAFVVDAISDEVDTFLFLIGPGMDDSLSDDDSGGGCNAQIADFFVEDGTYTVVVGGWGGSTGPFTVRASTRRETTSTDSCGGTDSSEILASLLSVEPSGEVGSGAEVTGTLGASSVTLVNGSPAEAWTVTGEPGQSLYVDLVSDEVDTVLLALSEDESSYETDDDSGGACNSRLRITLGADGTLRVVASAFSAGGSGAYILRVSETEAAYDPGDCPG